MPPTIERIETIPFRLPLHGALRWGTHSALSEAHHVLVRLTLSDGAVGYAEALPRPTIYGETVQSICHVIAHELGPRVIGRSAEFTPISAILAQLKNNQTARGAIDIALHDAVAQSNGVSLADALGTSRDRVRVSYILGIGDNDTMLAEAQRVYDAGVRVLKVKIGRNPQQDRERIALLKQIGSDLDLYVDANETLTHNNAGPQLDALRDLGILYCEEPLPVELIRERAALRAGEHMALIGDDSCFSQRDLARELALDTFDILNIKCARTGYTESLRMLALAQAAGKSAMIGSHASSRLGAARHGIFAALAAVEHPSELTFWLKMQGDICASPIPITDGYVAMRDLLNVQVDDDLLRQFSAA